MEHNTIRKESLNACVVNSPAKQISNNSFPTKVKVIVFEINCPFSILYDIQYQNISHRQQ